MRSEDLPFIVYEAVKSNPELAHDIIRAATDGCIAKGLEHRDRAADMEVVASIAFAHAADKGRVSPEAKKMFADLAKSKISKWSKSLRMPGLNDALKEGGE